ncbi:hypothetical protein M514_07488, partial [Trichuris suis]
MDVKALIEARIGEMEAAVRSKNASAIAALYTEDCHFMPNGMSPSEGRKAVEAYLKRDIADGVSAVTTKSTKIEVFGDYAFQCGTYTLEGTRGQETGAFVYLWKNVGGKWYIHVDCFNVISAAKG